MIRRWSMQGAARDNDGEELSADELRAALAPHWTPSANDHLRTREAGDGERESFLTAVEEDGEREGEPSE